MVDAGELAEYVNAGNVSFTNVTDSQTYKQMYRAKVFITQDIITNQTISNILDKHFQLRDFAIEGDIWLTDPEIGAWILLTIQTNNLPPSKSFNIVFTADDGGTATLTGTFRVKDLIYDAPEEGDSNYHVRLESVDGAVAVT